MLLTGCRSEVCKIRVWVSKKTDVNIMTFLLSVGGLINPMISRGGFRHVQRVRTNRGLQEKHNFVWRAGIINCRSLSVAIVR